MAGRDKDKCDRQEAHNVGNPQVSPNTSCSSEREDLVLEDTRSSLVRSEYVAFFRFSNGKCSVCPIVV